MGSFATLKVYEHESPWLLFFFLSEPADLSFAPILIGPELFSSQSESFWKGWAWQSFKTLSSFLLTLPAKRLWPSAQISFLSIMMA